MEQKDFNSLEKPEDPEDIAIKEIAYKWADDIRNEKYRRLIGQPPKEGLSEEQVAYGILHPEEEQRRVLKENQEEDKVERNRLYRRSPEDFKAT